MKALDKFLQKWRIHKVVKNIQTPVDVLDIGCFDTLLFEKLGSNLKSGVGIDPLLQPMVHGNITLAKGFFPQALPDLDKKYDAVTLLAVLEHIPYATMDAFTAKIADVLKPGGRVYITVPSPWVDYILVILKFLKLIDGMSLEEHHGYDVRKTPSIFHKVGLRLVKHQTFQLGLNHLYIFEKSN